METTKALIARCFGSGEAFERALIEIWIWGSCRAAQRRYFGLWPTMTHAERVAATKAEMDRKPCY